METTTMTKEVLNQQGLNQVVISKVERMLNRNRVGIATALSRLVEEGSILQDYIAPIGVELKKNDHNPIVTFSGNGRVLMNMHNEDYSLHPHAVGQLASKLNIPAAYLRTLATGDEWARRLAATLLNEHSGWTDRTRVLVRTVGNEVRGVLSDSYRRLNSQDIITAFINTARAEGAELADACVTDTKVYAEAIIPQPIVVPTAKNGDVYMFAGARFSTSDYGDGAVDMRAFLLNGVCLNGMVRESVMKQVHLGSRLPDNLMLSQRTYELDTQATVSAITDLTKGLFSVDTIRRKALEIQAASSVEVDIQSELRNMFKKGALLKSEREGVEKLLMNNRVDDGVQGESTLWKLSQGITAYARELDPVRSRELAELSGELMNRVAA